MKQRTKVVCLALVLMFGVASVAEAGLFGCRRARCAAGRYQMWCKADCKAADGSTCHGEGPTPADAIADAKRNCPVPVVGPCAVECYPIRRNACGCRKTVYVQQCRISAAPCQPAPACCH